MALDCGCPDCNGGKPTENWVGYCENASMENEHKHMKSQMDAGSWRIFAIIFAVFTFGLIASLTSGGA